MFHILLDMDMVLADFNQGAYRVHGFSEEKRTPGEWDMTKDMRVSLDDFWEPIHKEGEPFWTGLSILPWVDDLVGLITDDYWGSVSSVGIATTPSRQPSSYSGKAKWIIEHLGREWIYHFYPVHNKPKLATPDTILIDDREETCKKFAEKGGIAILFPSIGNRLHDQKDKPLRYVQLQLERITNTPIRREDS